MEARILNRLGLVYARQGKFNDADEATKQALTVAKAHQDLSAQASSLNTLGILASIRGEYTTAHTFYEESIALSRQVGELQTMASTLNNLGLLSLELGEIESAITYHEESLRLAKEIGDRQLSALILNNLGRIGNDYEKRRAYHAESLQVRRELGDKFGIGLSLYNLAAMALEQEEYQVALDHFVQCLTISRELGSLEYVAFAGAGRISVMLELGKEVPRADLLEIVRAVQQVNSIQARLDTILAALSFFPEYVAEWIGMIVEKSSKDYGNQKYLERMIMRAKAATGEDTYNAAYERGKSLELPTVIEEILHLLEAEGL